MNENIRLEWFKPDLTAPLEVPLMDSGVHAGFPSPADDSIEQPLDLNKLVAPNPNATFFARVVGDSMKDAHIEEGDLLAVDKSADPLDGDVVVSLPMKSTSLSRSLRTATSVCGALSGM